MVSYLRQFQRDSVFFLMPAWRESCYCASCVPCGWNDDGACAVEEGRYGLLVTVASSVPKGFVGVVEQRPAEEENEAQLALGADKGKVVWKTLLRFVRRPALRLLDLVLLVSVSMLVVKLFPILVVLVQFLCAEQRK